MFYLYPVLLLYNNSDFILKVNIYYTNHESLHGNVSINHYIKCGSYLFHVALLVKYHALVTCTLGM